MRVLFQPVRRIFGVEYLLELGNRLGSDWRSRPLCGYQSAGVKPLYPLLTRLCLHDLRVTLTILSVYPSVDFAAVAAQGSC